MKYVMIIIVMGVWQLQAIELSFTSLRLEEKALVLNAFKKLYKERRHIHKNMRQVLKHSRAKNLQKNRLSFFQPKMPNSLNYNEEHPVETNGVLVMLQTPCGDACILPSRPDAEGNTDVLPSGTDSGGTYDDGSIPSQDEQSGVRPTTISPWALR